MPQKIRKLLRVTLLAAIISPFAITGNNAYAHTDKTHRFACLIPGHFDAGMQGVINVVVPMHAKKS